MNSPYIYPEIITKTDLFFFIVFNENGTVLFANEYFLEKIFPSILPVSLSDFTGDSQMNMVLSAVKNTCGQASVISCIHLVLSLPTGTKISTKWNLSCLAEAGSAIQVHATGVINEVNTTENTIADQQFQEVNSDGRLLQILENINQGCLIINNEQSIHYCNAQAAALFKKNKETVLEKNFYDAFNIDTNSKFYTVLPQLFKNDTSVHFQDFLPGLQKLLEVSAYRFNDRTWFLFSDVTEKINTEHEVRAINERLNVVEKATNDVIWEWDMKANKFIWNDNAASMFGYSPAEMQVSYKWWYLNLHPDDRRRVKANLKKHIREHRVNWHNEYRFRCSGGAYKYVYDRGFAVYDNLKRPLRMIGTMQDLTERKASEFILKKLNNSLEKRARELAASNDELERFAYVTSHDLQEPLRMVTSFLQLLKKRYKDKLDEKAHEYIGFAVDGAERMKCLILDLLEYSRVNTNKEEMEEVNLNDVAAQVLLTYKQLLTETNGKITIQHLPAIKGNRTQLLQLLQNLIGNALKYRSKRPPAVEVACKQNPNEFEFFVKDNGIGIEQRFFDKIFVIFQRLHHKNEYSGTGIGLAICKKIIEKHGGRIWVESEPGEGSTFYFTIPK